MVSSPGQAVVTVLGIGNPIMGDDGIGCAVLARLTQAPREGVCYIDGGTSGMELLPDILDSRRLIVIDALKQPLPAGEVVVLRGDQIPRLLSSQLSPHQVGLLDLLSAARLLGQEPEAISVVGIVAAHVELSVDMTPEVAASMEQAVALVQEEIERMIAGAE